MSVVSLAVTVALPAVFKVTLKIFAPETSGAPPGMVALLSLDVIAAVSLTVETKFQSASTALTVTLNAVPAVSADGDPVLPVTVPGAAVSPGTNNCNFANAAALTEMEELVLAVFDPSLESVAVTVRAPAVFSMTLKVCVPATSAALDGRTALLSEEAIATLSLAFVTKFQFASTAFTVTLNGTLAVWAVGVPLLPDALPGEAVSPGARIWSFANAPAPTAMAGLV